MTVAQLEHALSARVRVEQAIGVLAERHRLRPRQAFDLLRNVARSRGQKVIEIAEAVVDSASNPLLPLPEELARQQPGAQARPLAPPCAFSGERSARPPACDTTSVNFASPRDPRELRLTAVGRCSECPPARRAWAAGN